MEALHEAVLYLECRDQVYATLSGTVCCGGLTMKKNWRSFLGSRGRGKEGLYSYQYPRLWEKGILFWLLLPVEIGRTSYMRWPRRDGKPEVLFTCDDGGFLLVWAATCVSSGMFNSYRSVPDGDWSCNRCMQASPGQKRAMSPARSPTCNSMRKSYA
jgi:hypothetical protein